MPHWGTLQDAGEHPFMGKLEVSLHVLVHKVVQAIIKHSVLVSFVFFSSIKEKHICNFFVNTQYFFSVTPVCHELSSQWSGILIPRKTVYADRSLPHYTKGDIKLTRTRKAMVHPWFIISKSSCPDNVNNNISYC